MPQIQINPRLRLYYLEYNPGGKASVLLLHGLGATGASWQQQVPELVQSGFHVLAPDTRGFGQSSYPGGSLSVADMASDFAALLEATHTVSAHVVGISMGGAQALQLALDYPQRVNRLVLVNTFARLRPNRLGGWLYFALRFALVHTLGLESQGKAVVKRIFPRPEQEELRQELLTEILQADPHGYRAAMRALGRFNVVGRLGEIRAPTLVITSENDTTVDRQNQRVLAEKIPGARQVVIPDAGHAVSVDQPETFNQVLISFLKNNARQGLEEPAIPEKHS